MVNKVVKQRELKGGEPDTTNNRMELMAAIQVPSKHWPPNRDHHRHRQQLRQKRHHRWIFGWKKNGWKNCREKACKNAELWQRLDTANARIR